ncbi:MAG: formylmethanofuran dehydrogenase subunit B, partial [Promethearchaeota archaeon]
MAQKKITTHQDILCPFCGTLCDDLEVDIVDNKVVEVRNSCQIGTKKFFSSNPSDHRYQKPQIKENGSFRDATWDEALDKAAEILIQAKRPLFYGFSSTECEAQNIGVELAEYLRAILDNT